LNNVICKRKIKIKYFLKCFTVATQKLSIVK
jgi:hypothetical protein